MVRRSYAVLIWHQSLVKVMDLSLKTMHRIHNASPTLIVLAPQSLPTD